MGRGVGEKQQGKRTSVNLFIGEKRSRMSNVGVQLGAKDDGQRRGGRLVQRVRVSLRSRRDALRFRVVNAEQDHSVVGLRITISHVPIFVCFLHARYLGTSVVIYIVSGDSEAERPLRTII